MASGHVKAEHMAAPTKPCDVKILLANSESPFLGAKRTFPQLASMSANNGEFNWRTSFDCVPMSRDPQRTFVTVS
jgi:hypothetical protein